MQLVIQLSTVFVGSFVLAGVIEFALSLGYVVYRQTRKR